MKHHIGGRGPWLPALARTNRVQRPASGRGELGMNHPGEIAELAAITVTAPTVALVQQRAAQHQEFMASIEAVARENWQRDRALARVRGGVPCDDYYTPLARPGRTAGPYLRARATPQGVSASRRLTCEAEWDHDHWAV